MQSSETIKHKVYKNYDMIDFAKIVLSIMVVCIHVPFCPEILKPYLRIAVPIFFMISSFLFSKKSTKLLNHPLKKASCYVLLYVIFSCTFFIPSYYLA